MLGKTKYSKAYVLIFMPAIAVTLTNAEGPKILDYGFARLCIESVIVDTLLRSLDGAREDKNTPRTSAKGFSSPQTKRDKLGLASHFSPVSR